MEVKRKARKFRWRKAPSVRCVACGFLTINGREVYDKERVQIQVRNAGLPSNIEALDCARGLWIDFDLMYAQRAAGAVLDEAAKERHCFGFLEHVPGWSPEGHRALLLRREDRRHDRISNALFALLGVALALLVQWLSKLLGLG